MLRPNQFVTARKHYLIIMNTSGGVLKVLPLQTFGLPSSRQAWRMQKTLLSTGAARTSQPKSSSTRSGNSATTTEKPPATPVNEHEAEPVNNPFGQPRFVSKGKLPPNYNATARRFVHFKSASYHCFKGSKETDCLVRVLTIMVGLPIFIVTSYILFERGKIFHACSWLEQNLCAFHSGFGEGAENTGS